MSLTVSGGNDDQLRLASTFGLTVGTTLAFGAEQRVVKAVLADNLVELTADIAGANVTNKAEYDPLLTARDAAQTALDNAIAADPNGNHNAEQTALTNAQNALDAVTATAFPQSVRGLRFVPGKARKASSTAKPRWIARVCVSFQTPMPSMKGRGDAIHSW